MSRLNPIKLCGVVAGLFLLAACGQSPDQAKPDAPADSKAESKMPDDQDWVQAAHSSGVEVPLTLRFDLPQRPVLGTPFPLRLRLEAVEAVDGLSLNLELPEGFTSLGAPISKVGPRMQAGSKIEHGLSLKAGREGIFEVRVRLTLVAGPGKERSAVYSIPLIVGAK